MNTINTSDSSYEPRTVFRLFKSTEHTTMIFLAVIIGIAGGFGAIGFRYLINFFQLIFYGSAGDLLNVAPMKPSFYRILIPAAGGLIVGPLVYFFAREAKGHGVPEVMDAVALKGGIIRKRIVIIKSLASAICIGSGGAVGREGPIVQIGSAIGSVLGQLLKVSVNRMRILVGCGAAAGISATFNAPIAGSMFALEIILGDFNLVTFSPIVVSAVVATAVSRHFLGDAPAFIVTAYKLRSPWEFPLYFFMGLFCAVIAVLFVKVLYKLEDLFEDFRFPEYLKAIVGGFILGIMALRFPHILGVGYGSIDLAFAQKLSWSLMLFLIFYKILATSITIGSGGSGGIFAPSLFIGAMAGGFFGSMVQNLFPNITASPGAYSVVGMGAVVAATTHGPLTAILMLFEMTGDYKIILPLMITCIISTLAAGRLSKESIYTLKLLRRGVDIRAGKEVNLLKSIPVKDVMITSVDTIPDRLSMDQLADTIFKSKHNTFPVVNSAGKLTGILSFNDYREAIFDENLKDIVVAGELATINLVTVTIQDNLYDALEKITSKDFAILPVVAPDDHSKLMGIITRRDIISAYDKAVLKKSMLS